jgi:hypothetical protein
MQIRFVPIPASFHRRSTPDSSPIQPDGIITCRRHWSRASQIEDDVANRLWHSRREGSRRRAFREPSQPAEVDIRISAIASSVLGSGGSIPSVRLCRRRVVLVVLRRLGRS